MFKIYLVRWHENGSPKQHKNSATVERKANTLPVGSLCDTRRNLSRLKALTAAVRLNSKTVLRIRRTKNQFAMVCNIIFQIILYTLDESRWDTSFVDSPLLRPKIIRWQCCTTGVVFACVFASCHRHPNSNIFSRKNRTQLSANSSRTDVTWQAGVCGA